MTSEEFIRLQNQGVRGNPDSAEPDYSQYMDAGGPATGMNLLAWRASSLRNANAGASAAADRGNMQSFIAANRTPQADALAGKTSADFGKYGNVLDSYLAQSAPVASTDNRFESGLASSEGRVNRLLDDPNSINQSAAYKFRVGQGQEALQRSLGAKGLLNSGNRLMELTKYGQDMGSQEYGNQYDRLKGLYDTNAQGWLGDKNANTSRFSAESTAHAGRGNMLSNLYGNAGTLANQSATAANNNAIQWGQLYEQGRQANQKNAVNVAQGGPSGTFKQAYGYGGY